ncbi:MAG: Ig-like domain-containing protein, partial [bacterium]
LCITNLEDNVSVSLCGPNRISRDTCVTYVVDLDGPVAQLISPPHGSSTACARENIRIRISDFSSILIDSVRVRIRGVLYTRASPRIRFSGDTLIFTPSSDWVNGDSVEIELVSAYDIAGNPLSGAPLRWYFRVDRRPPILWGASPPNLTIISNPSQLVSFFIYDSISGVDSSSVMVRARGRNYGLGSPGFALSGNQIRFNPSLAGLTISNGDTVLYCAFGADRVSGTLCGPNRSDTLCTRIIYDLSPPISNILIPDNGSYSSCVDQNIILQLYDLYGINTNSIRLTVNGITYSIDSSQVSYVDTLLIFTPTRLFHHNDTVNISLMVSDIAGNTYASPRTWRFFIDTIPPVISSTQPAPGSFVGREDTISFMVNDGTSGVDWTSLRVEIGGFVFRLGDRGVVRDGNRVYLVLDSLGLSFAGVETVPVCISVSDNSRYCGANRLTQCFNYAFDLAGPIPILLLPAHNSISACSTQSIRIAFSDPNGLRRTSVILRINGVNYNSSSSQIRFTDSTLIFTPTTRWSEGIVTVRVLSVSDTLGNTTSMDFDWLFGIDYSPPFVLGY